SGAPTTPVARAGVLVAAEIARSGRAAGEALARRLAPDLDTSAIPFQPNMRILGDSSRLDVARSTLESMRRISDDRYSQVLNEARLIITELTGAAPSMTGLRGQSRVLIATLLMTAAEIPWAGHGAARRLAADILGIPRAARVGAKTRFVAGLANAARHDPDRARTTLGLLSDTRREQLGHETDAIIREAITHPLSGPARERAPREWRLLVAAEIARSGAPAGQRLARALVADTPLPRPATQTPPKRVRFADETPEPDLASEDGYDSEIEFDPKTETETETVRPPEPVEDPVTPEGAPVRMPVEEVIEKTGVGVVDGRVVAVWLPGAIEEGLKLDLKMLLRLNEVLLDGTVFVFGAMRDGRVMSGDREITVNAAAAAIASKAPGLSPFLLMKDSTTVAEPLARVLEEPVLASKYEGALNEETGHLVPRRPTDGETGPLTQDEWFHMFAPGEEQSRPFTPGLFPSGHRTPPGEEPGTDPLEVPAPRNETPPEPPESRVPPEPPAPPESTAPPVMTPLAADPMVHSIGVPRAGLPQMAQLVGRIRHELTQAGAHFTENEINLLPHRLLSNYPYLLGDDAPDGTRGLQVPIGDAELLVSIDPTDPHTLGDPAGSTITPSTLPPVEGEHKATGTINSVFATGAHVQVQSGQTGATRGAIALTFGIGATPFTLQVVKIGGALSGTANQSNRSGVVITDAEGGHVEDNRSESKLIAYTARWSFKVRVDPNKSWETTPVNRLTEPTGERLLLWIPDHYLETAPDQVTATGARVKDTKLPAYFFASGMTNLPRLFDEIVTTLRENGLKLPMGSLTRKELLQKLWNLNMHLDAAVNKRSGYNFELHNRYGRPVATVTVRSERLAAAPRVGATSDKSHIENVRTAIDGLSGSHTITNTSTLAFPSVEFDLMPVPGNPDPGLGVIGSLSYTSTNTNTTSAGKVGLNVLVPRDVTNTAAYQMSFRHRATVSVRGNRNPAASRATGPVRGDALVRMPEAAAYEHGFSVDRTALKRPPKQGRTQEFAEDAIRTTSRPETDPAKRKLPKWTEEGNFVGTGLVSVSPETVQNIENAIKPTLRQMGFLPENDDHPFAGYSWYGHGNKTDSQIDNLGLFDKMVSSRGFDSHYDQAHQDGMVFTLRKRRGGVGMDLDVDSVEIRIVARPDATRPPEFLRTTKDFHTVNLAMGMDSAGMSFSHSRKVAVGVKMKGLFQQLKAALMGFEYQRTVGATDALNYLTNMPDLRETSERVMVVRTTSDYTVHLSFQHSGRQGRVRPGRRDPLPIEVKGGTADLYVLPLGTEPGDTKPGLVPAHVLDQGVIYFMDTTGVRDAVQPLGRLTDPAGTGAADRNTFTGNIEMRAHGKEMLRGEYTTDRLFESGAFRDRFGAIDIKSEMSDVTFGGVSNDPGVLGLIKLGLMESRLTASSSHGWTWDQLDLAVGDDVGTAHLTGETDVNRHWQHNLSLSSSRVGGDERLQLSFERWVIFHSNVSFQVRSRMEKHAKLMPTGSPEHSSVRVGPRKMAFILPETEALAQYAGGDLPLSDRYLRDVMRRWQVGSLKLSGNLVARILTRWNEELPAKLHTSRFADTLAHTHRTGMDQIQDPALRAEFNRVFGRGLETPGDASVWPNAPADLVAYARGRGSLTDQRLVEVLRDWQAGRLRLRGDVVARALTRWHEETPTLPNAQRAWRDRFVHALARMHDTGAARVQTRGVRNAFDTAFGVRLEPPVATVRPPAPADVVAYAEGRAPLTDQRLGAVLREWRSGDQRYDADLVARLLLRRQEQLPDVRVRPARFAETLDQAHRSGVAQILDDGVRDRFNRAFGRRLAASYDPFEPPAMPPDVVAYAEGRA
ncbi:MAG: hypothetical protein ACRDP6_40085, partial [Actinoallomurus sp.]